LVYIVFFFCKVGEREEVVLDGRKEGAMGERLVGWLAMYLICALNALNRSMYKIS
jgi:hypothetical protein